MMEWKSHQIVKYKNMPPTTLYEYYQSQGKPLPSLQERAPLYTQQGGQGEYQGTTEQNQFLLNKLTTTPTTPTTPTIGSGTYIEDVTKNLDKTNGDPTKIVGTSDAERARIRKEEIDKIKKELEPSVSQPGVYKSADEYKKMRKEQGIVKDEEELTSIQNEANLAKEELRKYKTTAGEAMPEGGRIGAVSEAERNLNFRLEGLALREQAALSRVNTKNAYISNMLKLGQQDYTNSLNEYNAEYNKNLKAVELYNGEENELTKDAIASLTTITNLVTDKGILYKDLNEATKSQIETLSVQAGLPQGLIQQAMAIAPEDKIQTTATRTDASGNEYFDILRVKPNGEMYVQKVYRGTGKQAGALIGTTGTQYTRGENLVVDSWVDNIEAGTAKISSVPKEYKNAVSVALSQKAQQKSLDSGIMDKLNDVNQLIDNEGIGEITGSIDQFRPTWLMSDKGRLAKNTIDKIVGALKLDNRKLLKGTGTISDFEFKILGEAATALNRNLGEEDFKNQLQIIRGAFQTASGLSAKVKVTAPDGKFKVGEADRSMINDAIASGYKIDYLDDNTYNELSQK